MVADGVLDFKIAVPRAKLDRGDFHDKFGIFTDADGNQVSFNGSYNDSIQGTRNYESVKVFSSWVPAFAPLVAGDAARFKLLWGNDDPNVRVYDVPEATRADILQLRTSDRPYQRPAWVSGDSEETRKLFAVRPMIPPSVSLRDYQEAAIAAWRAEGDRGLLEMATGAGKTITALAAAVRVYQEERRLALIVIAPYQHLVEQWADEARVFGFSPLLAYGSRKSWLDEWHNRIMRFNAKDADVISLITTYDTFCTEHFQASLARLQGPTLLIADEAHHFGAEQRRRFYPEPITKRLALSATPERWHDEIGTAALTDVFRQDRFPPHAGRGHRTGDPDPLLLLSGPGRADRRGDDDLSGPVSSDRQVAGPKAGQGRQTAYHASDSAGEPAQHRRKQDRSAGSFAAKVFSSDPYPDLLCSRPD